MSERKEKLISIGVLILVTGLMYLLFSFIHWDFNPDKWSGLSRFITGFTFIIWTIKTLFD